MVCPGLPNIHRNGSKKEIPHEKCADGYFKSWLGRNPVWLIKFKHFEQFFNIYFEPAVHKRCLLNFASMFPPLGVARAPRRTLRWASRFIENFAHEGVHGGIP